MSMVIDKVREYIKLNNLRISTFEKKCGLGNGTVRGWVNGNPRVETLEKLEEATGIPVAEWIKKEEE
jgi:transcriptional regulator with XRE-family HTH domain